MFDIDFYMKVHNINTKLQNNESLDKEFVFEQLEAYRNKEPIVFNIETTNACNMRCKMCPRTTRMTRTIDNLDYEMFKKIVNQLKPHSPELWEKWKKFVYKVYNIPETDMSENNFFLYIIPKVIQLHGYGDPLLDTKMHKSVELLTERGFESYFSCNPANIDINLTESMFKAGLNYIKYSIESVDDEIFKSIRGKAANFTQSFEKIKRLIELKEQNGYQTVIIITMLDLNNKNQQEEYQLLKEKFADFDVYIFLKSEDQQWYRKDYHGTKAIHWSEFCKHPWMSMTIKSNCEVAMCMEDYDNEIILGDARKYSLYEIWNGSKYQKFRKDHFSLTSIIKCTEECDMKLIGSYFKKN